MASAGERGLNSAAMQFLQAQQQEVRVCSSSAGLPAALAAMAAPLSAPKLCSVCRESTEYKGFNPSKRLHEGGSLGPACFKRVEDKYFKGKLKPTAEERLMKTTCIQDSNLSYENWTYERSCLHARRAEQAGRIKVNCSLCGFREAVVHVKVELLRTRTYNKSKKRGSASSKSGSRRSSRDRSEVRERRSSMPLPTTGMGRSRSSSLHSVSSDDSYNSCPSRRSSFSDYPADRKPSLPVEDLQRLTTGVLPTEGIPQIVITTPHEDLKNLAGRGSSEFIDQLLNGTGPGVGPLNTLGFRRTISGSTDSDMLSDYTDHGETSSVLSDFTGL